MISYNSSYKIFSKESQKLQTQQLLIDRIQFEKVRL